MYYKGWISFILFFLLVLSTPLVTADKIEVMVERDMKPASALNTLGDEKNKVYDVMNVSEARYEEMKEAFPDKVQKNYEVVAFLDDSTGIIDANKTWNLTVNETNLTGKGQTSCVIDSGVDYTHSAFGNCNPSFSETLVNYTLNSSIAPDSTDEDTDFFYEYYDVTPGGVDGVSINFSTINISDQGDRVAVVHENYVYDTFTSTQNNAISKAMPDDSNVQIQVRYNKLVAGNNTKFSIDQVINKTSDWSSCDDVEGGFNFQQGSLDPDDAETHGTHVASTAVGNNSQLSGVAPDSNLYVIRSLGVGGGNFIDIGLGINECVKQADEHNISSIVMSLGTTSYTNNTFCDSDFSSTAPQIDKAVENNITVAVATGNSDSTTGITSPACITNSTRVAATDKQDNPYDFNNRGGFTDILLAPGVNINAAEPGESYGTKSGTSMATPHVAALTNIVRQNTNLRSEPEYTRDENIAVMNSTGKKIFDSGTNKNYTRINAYNTIQEFNNAIDLEINLSKTSLTFNKDNQTIKYSANTFARDITEKNITVTNSDGEQVLFEDNISKSTAILNTSLLNTTGTYTVNVSVKDNESNHDSKTKTFNVTKEIDITLDILEKTVIYNKDNQTINYSANTYERTVSEKNITVKNNNSDTIFFEDNISKNTAILNTSLLNTTGTYTVNVSVKDNESNVESKEKTFDVEKSNITLNLSLSKDIVEKGNTITINHTATSSNASIIEKTLNVTHNQSVFYEENLSKNQSVLNSTILNETGVYNVSLFAEDSTGVTSNISQTFSVKKIPRFNITFNGQSGNRTLHYENNITENVTIKDAENISLYVNGTFNKTFATNTTRQLNLSQGIYTFTYNQSETDTYLQQEKSYTLNVTDLSPSITGFTPSKTNLTLQNNETEAFTINTTNPGSSLTYNWTINSTTQTTTENYTFNASQQGTGSYNLTVMINNTYGKDTQTWTIHVFDELKPTITSYEPNKTDLERERNQTISFSANVSNPKGNLTHNWKVNSSIKSTNESYTLNTSNIGVGNHTIEYVVTNSYGNDTQTWNVTVKQNLSPTITSISPNETTLYRETGENVTFKINTTNPSKNNLSYTWTVSGNTSSQENYTLNTSLVGEGNYTVDVEINNTKGNDSQAWNITVKDDLSPQLITSQPNETEQTLAKNQTLTFSINTTNPTNTNLSYSWSVNNSNVSANETYVFNISNKSLGDYEVKGNVKNTYGSVMKQWNVTIQEDLKPTIQTFTPSTDVNTTFNTSIPFNQTTQTPTNSNLSYYWYENESLKSNDQNFTYNTSPHMTGTFNITFIAENDEGNASRTTLINVFNNTILFDSNISDISFEEDQSKEVNLSDHFTYEGYLPINYSLLNLSNSSDISLTVNDSIATFMSSDPQTETVRLQANTNESNATSNFFDISVKQKSDEEEDDDSGGGGGGGGGIPPQDEDQNQTDDDEENETDDEASYEEEFIEEPNYYSFFSERVTDQIDIQGQGNNTLQRLRVNVSEELNNVSLEINETKTLSTEFDGEPYKYLTISYDEIHREKFRSALFEFTIPKKWMDNNGVEKDDISLFRYDTSWKNLSTDSIQENTTTVTFEARSPGLSIFSIGTRNTSNTIQQVDEPGTDPAEELEEQSPLVSFTSILITSLLSVFLVLSVLTYLLTIEKDEGDEEQRIEEPQKQEYTKEDLYQDILKGKDEKRIQNLKNLIVKAQETDDPDSLKKIYLLMQQEYEKINDKRKLTYKSKMKEIEEKINLRE